ncbi:MAG: 2-C-methyl-D-erythritol 4-phosphate cytidylyltransferase, partial [Trueperaceae bacterium]|nr:2-C-methyl-D-erythritol 4-phosphate cytidylyltransferase [Trueperaceae bacterium]
MPRTTPRTYALVPAAGQGTRMGESTPKQYLPIAGLPMLRHSLVALAAVARVARVVAILAPEDAHWEAHDWSGLAGRVEALRAGGETRARSVANALERLAGEAAPDDWVLVHDAARPCVTAAMVERLLDEVGDDAVGGLLAMPVADTLKREGEPARVGATVPREGLWRAQTPQLFRYALLRRALAEAPAATDESQAVESLGHRPRLVQGDNANFKVTFP